MEIIANVHLISNVTTNLYLIVDSNGLALIDAGLPGSDKKILKYITGYGPVVIDAANKFPKI